jgi:hypothetical protein
MQPAKTLNGAAVKHFEDLRAHAKSFQSGERRYCRAFFKTAWVCVHHVNSSVMWTPRTLKLCLIAVGDQSYHRRVVSKLAEQGVQEGSTGGD